MVSEFGSVVSRQGFMYLLFHCQIK